MAYRSPSMNWIETGETAMNPSLENGLRAKVQLTSFASIIDNHRLSNVQALSRYFVYSSLGSLNICSVVPASTNWPSFIIKIRSAIDAALKSCVTNKIAMPPLHNCLSNCINSIRLQASIAVVASSATNIVGCSCFVLGCGSKCIYWNIVMNLCLIELSIRNVH